MADQERRGHLSPLFTWRSAICQSDLPSTSRHVALVLSLHMSELGESCYPSQARLAKETGLARETVSRHLAKLEEEGWIAHVGWKSWETPGGEQKTKVWKALTPRGCQRITPLEEGCDPNRQGCDSNPQKGVTQDHTRTSRGRQRSSGRAHAREGNSRPSGPGDVTPAGVDCPDCGEDLRLRAGGLYCVACARWKDIEE